MKATSKYNRTEIMREAWKLYRSNRSLNMSFSWALSVAWRNAKVRIQSEAITENNRIKEEERRTIQRENIITKIDYNRVAGPYVISSGLREYVQSLRN